jgi:voltage-dependent potassium channel beta subunit
MATSSDLKSKMEYRYLGNSGLRVSVLSFGAWVNWNTKTEDLAYECAKAALDAGCNFLDNAEVYCAGEAETCMGNVLKRLNKPRSELVISTKIFWGGPGVNERGLSRKHIIEGTYASLQRLQLDYVDLLFCHRPDEHTTVEEVVRAMNFLINQGKTFYWGTSEWRAEQLREAYHVALRLNLIPPLMEQPQYSMLHRTRVEKEYGKLYTDIGLGTTIWSPLASGLLTGKYTKDAFPDGSRLADGSFEGKVKFLRDSLLSGKGLNGLETTDLDRIFEIVEGLKPIAEKLGCSLAQLAIAWCAKNPRVSTVITGASRVEQVHENFKALEVIPKLTPEVLEEIEQVLKNKPEEYRDFRA